MFFSIASITGSDIGQRFAALRNAISRGIRNRARTDCQNVLVRLERRAWQRAELAGERGERLETLRGTGARDERSSTGEGEEAGEVTARERAHESSTDLVNLIEPVRRDACDSEDRAQFARGAFGAGGSSRHHHCAGSGLTRGQISSSVLPS